MSEFFLEKNGNSKLNTDFSPEIISNKPIYNIFLCYFDEKIGHLPLYTFPAYLKHDKNEIKIIKIHSIWFLDINSQSNLQHVDLDYHNKIYLAIKFLGKSWREKERAGLKKDTPETYVLILSILKQYSFLGSNLLMSVFSKIHNYSDELYILIKKEIASKKILKNEKDRTVIDEGNVIVEELNKICEKLLPKIPQNSELESLASAETKKNQKLAFLFLQEMSQNTPAEPRNFDISVKEDIDKKTEDRAIFIKPIIIKSIETIDYNEKIQLTLKNQNKDLRNIRIQISRIEEFFETSSWETTVDIWFANEELVFKYPLSNIKEKFQIIVENKDDGSKIITKEIKAKDYIKKTKSFFDTITANDFMDKNPLTISYSSDIKSAVIKMNENKTDYIIITLDERPIGVITNRDLLKKVLPIMIDQNISSEKIKCKNIMSSPIQYVKKDDNIRKAALLMIQTGIKKLPILEDDKLIGMIRTKDLINLYLKQKLKDPDLKEKYKQIANLNKYSIKEIMNKNVAILDINSKFIDVINIMNEKRIGSVIISIDGKAKGIITERSILRRIIAQGKDPRTITLEQIMSSPMIKISENDTIDKAVQITVNKGIRYVIVMNKDDDSEIEGIVSITDILNLDLSKVSPQDLDFTKIF